MDLNRLGREKLASESIKREGEERKRRIEERKKNAAQKTEKKAVEDKSAEIRTVKKQPQKYSRKFVAMVERIVLALAVLLIIVAITLVLKNKFAHGGSSDKADQNRSVIQSDTVNSTVSDEEGLILETETELPETEEVIDLTTKEGRAKAKGLPAPPNVDINSWEYLLVNTENTIDETFVPEIGYATSRSSSTEQDVRIIEALNSFAAAAEAEGLPVYLSSGYRSYWDQKYLYDLKCQEYDPETAATIVAIPGTSEHQTGLSCDITDIYRSPKTSDLENTDTYKWMSAHCAGYGFIVRFPNNKSDITHIIYEPWHFRYVGKEAAAYIMENDLTLEEFVALYQEEQ